MTAPVKTLVGSNGALTLWQSAGIYQVSSGLTLEETLSLGGSAISVGQLPGYAPIGLEAVAGGGFEVMWEDAATSTFVGLDFDSAGNFTSAATAVLAGSSYALQSLEPGFGADLNADTAIGPKITNIASNGAIYLAHIADEFEITSGGVQQAILQVGGGAIVSGQFAGFAPVAVETISGGYEVMFQSASSFVGLDFDASGNFTQAATSLLAGSSYALESLETGFARDLNGDGTTGPKISSIASNGAFGIANIADEFEITSGGVQQAILQVGGSAIISGQFAGFAPVAVEASYGGYEVMFQSGSSFVGLNFNASGNFTQAATSVLAGSSYALQSLEPGFGKNLNGDTVIGPTTSNIDVNSTVSLVSEADAFVVISSGQPTQAVLQVAGSQIVSGNFAGFTPVAVLANSGGYEVMFKSGTSFIGLEFNTSGNFVSAATSLLSSGTYALESLDSAFNISLDSAGPIGPVLSGISYNGPYTLQREADEFTIRSNASLEVVLKVAGTPIVSGQFAGYNPVAMLTNAGGYEVMFRNATSFVGLEFDSTGNFTQADTGMLSSGTYALESLDSAFNASLDGNGAGNGPWVSTIALNGVYSLAQEADAFAILSGGTLKAVLKVSGNQIVSGQFAGFNPVALESNASGFEMMFKSGSGFIGLDFDSSGNFTQAATALLGARSYALESLEQGFNVNLNGDAVTGIASSAIVVHNSTGLGLWHEADEFAISSGALQSILQVAGAPIVSGQFAGFDPIDVAAISGGFEVMFVSSAGMTGPTSGSTFLGLDFTSSGAFTSAATSVLAISSQALWAQETLFGTDFNGDSQIGPPVSNLRVDNGTTLSISGTTYRVASNGGAPVTLTLSGTPLTSNTSVAPIGALAVGGGYEVVWQSVGANAYSVLKFDTTGAYTSTIMGPVTGQNFQFEQLEPTFGQDLNGDGRLMQGVFPGAVSFASFATSQESYIITLATNTAAAPSLISAATLTVSGTPSVVVLGSTQETIQLPLAPSAGIDVISGFTYTTDELNIDLLGAANATLRATATTYNSQAAITLYSTADLSHGIILTGYNSAVTAANIISGHTNFIGGHALIT